MSNIEKYFNAEKNESVLFIAIGLVMILISLYFFIKVKQSFYYGIGASFVSIALIQLIVGVTVYLRSPKDIQRVNKIISNEPSLIQSEEIPRMKTVMKSFVIYRWVEIALIVIALFSLLILSSEKAFLKGISIGLLIQASCMLILDYFAEQRGKLYIEYLVNLFK